MLLCPFSGLDSKMLIVAIGQNLALPILITKILLKELKIAYVITNLANIFN